MGVPGFQAPSIDDVHLHTEEIAQLEDEPRLVEERPPGFEFDQEIDI